MKDGCARCTAPPNFRTLIQFRQASCGGIEPAPVSFYLHTTPRMVASKHLSIDVLKYFFISIVKLRCQYTFDTTYLSLIQSLRLQVLTTMELRCIHHRDALFSICSLHRSSHQCRTHMSVPTLRTQHCIVRDRDVTTFAGASAVLACSASCSE
jgi:hypothetical protein